MSKINGGTPNNPKYSFAIIKHRGDLNTALTADGHRVYREEKIFLEDWGRFVMCAPYSEHFVFLDPAFADITGRWFAGCSCGSFAVIVGAKAYAKDASPTSGGGIYPGELLVCYQHAATGKHVSVAL